MNTFNRVAMIIILLSVSAIIALGILALLFIPASLGPLFTNLSTRLGSPAGDPRLRDLQLEMTVLGLILFVPCVVLLLLELRRTARDSIRITNVSGSEAHLSTQAVAQSLIYYVSALPGIARVKPRLVASKKNVNVRLDVETMPDVDVRAKTTEITQTARSVIEDKLGLKLNRLNIQIHHAAYPRGYTPQPPVVTNPSPSASAGSMPTESTENKNPLSS